MNSVRSSNIGFIGAGIVGTTLAMNLYQKGIVVRAVASQSYSSAECLASLVPNCQAFANPQHVANTCNLVFLTVPDDAINSVASSVTWHQHQSVVHCSGAKPLDVLEPARAQGAQVGGFHPLQTFGTLERGSVNLDGTSFALEGEAPLLEDLKLLAQSLGGEHFEIPASGRALYHASAVMVCSYIVTLADSASKLWNGFGFDSLTALDALIPLMEGTLQSLKNNGIPQSLTGPLVRGDVETIRLHLETLWRQEPHLLPLYCAMGLATLELVQVKVDLNQATLKQLETLLAKYASGARSISM